MLIFLFKLHSFLKEKVYYTQVNSLEKMKAIK